MQKHSSDTDTDILIIGAGPAGLMMAGQLALRNIPFRIIDKKSNGVHYSGALIIQTRSLEIFQQMGIAQSAIRHGIFANEIRLIFNGKKSVILPVKNIGAGLSRFPHMLMLEQSKTEKILTDLIHKYGYSVEQETELMQIIPDDDGITSVLKTLTGKVEVIRSKYLIAADGAHSSVRKQLEIPFVGKTYSFSLFVTDCIADGDFNSNQICFSFSDKTTAGFFPLPDGRWRIDGIISQEMELKEAVSFSDIGKSIAEKTRMNIRISNPDWFSIFQVNERYAKSFQQNRCFLVGDAAHIQSPVGAQGMNTGLQDSYNLAWKLGLVISGEARPALLNSYSSEREVIGKNIVLGTHNPFNILTNRNFFIKYLRIYVLPFFAQLAFPFLLKQKIVRHFLFKRISEVGVQYRISSFTSETSLGRFSARAPKPGDRLPYLKYSEDGMEGNIQDKVNGLNFHLFIFSGDKHAEVLLKAATKYLNSLSAETIPHTSGTSNLYKRLGIQNFGCYLIRPDLHIAYRSVYPDVEHFERYLQQI